MRLSKLNMECAKSLSKALQKCLSAGSKERFDPKWKLLLSPKQELWIKQRMTLVHTLRRQSSVIKRIHEPYKLYLQKVFFPVLQPEFERQVIEVY